MAEYPQKTYIGTQAQIDGIAPVPGNFKVNRDSGAAFFELDAQGNKVTLAGGEVLPEISFPPALYLAQGKPYEIYYESLLAVLPEGYTVLVSGANAGYSYERKFAFSTELATGSYGIKVRVYDRNAVEVYTKSASVEVYRQSTAPATQKLMFIGDSLTALGTNAMKQMEDYCAQDFGVNRFAFVGTKGASPYNHEGIGGGSVSSLISGGANNPFWDPEKDELSFSYYESANGIRPNIVCIHLGINDLVSAERDAQETVSKLGVLVDRIHLDWPEALVYIVTCGQVAGQDALANNWLSNFKALADMDRAVYDYASGIYGMFSEYSRVRVVPNYYAFDREYNYAGVEVDANPFVSQTVPSQTDPLHPREEAYRQIGANIYHTWMSSPYTGGDSVTLTNLIENPAFDGLDGWTVYNEDRMTLTPNGDGTAIGVITNTNAMSNWYVQQSYGEKLAVGHKYYSRITNRNSLVVDGAPSGAFHQMIFQQAFTDGTSSVLIKREAPNSLAVSSDILEVTSGVSNTYFRIWFGLLSSAVITGTESTVGNVMVIDLTAAFGAGNEPDKTWCDANIPFFNGSITL